MDKLCGNCFQQVAGDICPHCGYNETTQREKYPLALRPGSILNGRYIVGRVLGQGGFGITYIAWDDLRKERIAIKEYLPIEHSGRAFDGCSVQVYSEERQNFFGHGKEQFLTEAKTLADFIGNEHIVSIYSYFEENNTAYFTMEYLEGQRLDKYVSDAGGKISVEAANEILVPIMEALEWVHSKGVVHRDVSPDNIIVRKDGTAKLIDFGAARYSTGEKSRSLDVILKHGFAPKEQYMRRGRQGPFTDVYAMAATYYYAVTGRVPPEALQRLEEDELFEPSTLGIKMPGNSEDVLLKALEVTAQDRYQTMGEFIGDFRKQCIITPKPKLPDYEEILSLIKAAFDANDYKATISYCLEALTVKKDSYVYGLLGTAYKNCGEIGKACEAYKSAIAINPENLDLLSNLGVLELELKNYRPALYHLKEAYDRMPMDFSGKGEFIANYALAVAKNGNKIEGQRLLEEAEQNNYTELDAIRKQIEGIQNVRVLSEKTKKLVIAASVFAVVSVTAFALAGSLRGKTSELGEMEPSSGDMINSELSESDAVVLELETPVITLGNDAITGKPAVSWSEVPGAEEYYVYVLGDLTSTYTKLIGTEYSSYVHAGAEVGKTYHYKVKAVCSDGSVSSGLSEGKNIVCNLRTPNLTLSNDSVTGKPIVSWSESPGAIEYVLYTHSSATNTYARLTNTTDTSYIHSDAKAGETYSYKIRAIYSDPTANSGLSARRAIVCDLMSPVILVGRSPNNSKPVIYWDPVPDAVGYDVYSRTEETVMYTKIDSTTATMYTHEEAKTGEIYYYKVRAVYTNTAANSDVSPGRGIVSG